MQRIPVRASAQPSENLRSSARRAPLPAPGPALNATPVVREDYFRPVGSLPTAAELQSRLGPGTALPAALAQSFSASYGQDLNNVRIHTESSVVRSLGARAITAGNHIAFAPGAFQPGSPEGKHLIGHELAHVVQQRHSGARLQADGWGKDVHELQADAAAKQALEGSRVAGLPVSSPSDPAEREAVSTAKRVMSAPPKLPPTAPMVARQPGLRGVLRKAAAGVVTKAAAALPRGTASSSPRPGGLPLPASVRSFMEPRFGADFRHVRVHTDGRAAQAASALKARAFTVGQDIFFGAGAYAPESAEGKELIAHELTHTLQGAPGVHRAEEEKKGEEPKKEEDGVVKTQIKSWLKEHVNSIDGYRLLTMAVGYDPIEGKTIKPTTSELLQAVVKVLPGGSKIVEVLNEHKVFDKVGAWLDQKIKEIKHIGTSIKNAIVQFVKDFIAKPSFTGLLEKVKLIFTTPYEEVKTFLHNLVDDIRTFIKDAILKPLAGWAADTFPNAWNLLCIVLNKNPITGEAVEGGAEALIGGFMKLCGQEEVWKRIQEGKAIDKAMAWFKGAMGELKGKVAKIPGLVIDTLKSLELTDFLTIVGIFGKIARGFGGFVLDFTMWAGSKALALLELVVKVVSPPTWTYLARTGAALKGILQNPMPFAKNLAAAAKGGFELFSDNFGEHFKKGLLNWLVGEMPGIYIPKALELKEVATFVVSVLGISWANIRAKLVKAIGPQGEVAVRTLEAGAGVVMEGLSIVKTLVTQGPMAAWAELKDKLSGLKDQVVEGLQSMVTELIITKAIPMLLSKFVPGLGFVSALVSIYETIQTMRNQLKNIAAAVSGFVDGIVAISQGQIKGAAIIVNNVLGRALSLAISLLAAAAGLGRVSEKVRGVIDRVRQPVDKAIDAVVARIAAMIKPGIDRLLNTKLGKKLAEFFGWGGTEGHFKDEEGHRHTVLVKDGPTPTLMVASNPLPAEQFLNEYLAKKGPEFSQKNREKIGAVRTAIAASSKIVKDIASKKKDRSATLTELRQKLLNSNVALSGSLGSLINSDTSIGKMREKYLLEGLTGTYGSMPKPKGDGFTADHQPQAAILEAAAEFHYFRRNGELVKRAAQRAKSGYAINLHHNRHTAGATYGSKGKSTKNDFLARIKPQVMDKEPEKQRSIVVAEIKADLMRDVASMKKAAAPESGNWSDILEGKNEKEEKKLVKEVSGQIMQGQAQIAAQDIESLVG